MLFRELKVLDLRHFYSKGYATGITYHLKLSNVPLKTLLNICRSSSTDRNNFIVRSLRSMCTVFLKTEGIGLRMSNVIMIMVYTPCTRYDHLGLK